MIKQFQNVEDNTVFKINDTEYRKVPQVKISCCKSINAVQVANEANRTYIQPSTEVEVSE